MPKSHKIDLSGNPTDGFGLKEMTIASLGDRAKVIEFLFDERKNIALVTIETPGDKDLSFEEVSSLVGDIPKYQIGPINLERID